MPTIWSVLINKRAILLILCRGFLMVFSAMDIHQNLTTFENVTALAPKF